MAHSNLVYYPQMRKVVEYYRESEHYSGENLVTFEDFSSGSGGKNGPVTILGRHGNCHQYDYDHVRLLRAKQLLGSPESTSLVVFDFHEDIDSDVNDPCMLNSGSWVYLGLEHNLYANAYILGTNPKGYNEPNTYFAEGELHRTSGCTWRQMHRLMIYPMDRSLSIFSCRPEWEQNLEGQESISFYHQFSEEGFAIVRFKSLEEATFEQRQESLIVSIDLDVLSKSAVQTLCPQGVMSTDTLLSCLRRVTEDRVVSTVLICGLKEDEDEQDEHSLAELSRILAAANALLLSSAPTQ